MNILYLTLDDFDSLIRYRSINTDLLREFLKHGHRVHVVSPSERRKNKSSCVMNENDAIILKPRIGNIQKTNILEKGISTVTVGELLIKSIKKYLSNVRFDLVLYCTPPITFLSAVGYVKKRDGAKTYLLLKDIFPQNAVDLGMMQKKGVRGFLYRYFRRREKKLYRISDHIGCMSQANADYVIEHNRELDGRKIAVCPNCMEIKDRRIGEVAKQDIRREHGLPPDKIILVYGGNLGKPQGVDFIIKCIHGERNNDGIFFLVAGDGTDYGKLVRYAEKHQQKNLRLMKKMPRRDYENIVAACDAGMIFLDCRFTIPNFPSRLLDYLSAGLPVLASTDANTDIGNIIVENGFGWWNRSDDAAGFRDNVKRCAKSNLKEMGDKGFGYLCEEYDAGKVYRRMMDRLESDGRLG